MKFEKVLNYILKSGLKRPICAKVFSFYIILIVFGIFSIIGLTNFVVDPYLAYRKPAFYKPIFTAARYQAAGLVKHYDFQSVLLGSSMTENFQTDWLNEIMPNSIKLPFSGANIAELGKLLKFIFKHKANLNSALIGIDVGHLIPEKNLRMPEFMYDDNLINDLAYIMSYKTLEASGKNLIKRKQDEIKRDENIMYEWQYKLKDLPDGKTMVEQFKNNSALNTNTQMLKRDLKYDKEKSINGFKNNLMPFFIRHTDTKFILFFPPYSLVFFKDLYNRGELDNFLNIKLALADMVQNLKNVELYDFELDIDTITTFKYYGDMVHYIKPVNYKMIEYIKTNKFKVNNINEYKRELENFAIFVKNYKL